MPRNLDHRVELAVPIETAELRAELLDTLERAFADNQSSWELDAEGVWQRRSPGPGERRLAACSWSSPSCTPRARRRGLDLMASGTLGTPLEPLKLRGAARAARRAPL